MISLFVVGHDVQAVMQKPLPFTHLMFFSWNPTTTTPKPSPH